LNSSSKFFTYILEKEESAVKKKMFFDRTLRVKKLINSNI